jgi:hypothetical protein
MASLRAASTLDFFANISLGFVVVVRSTSLRLKALDFHAGSRVVAGIAESLPSRLRFVIVGAVAERERRGFDGWEESFLIMRPSAGLWPRLLRGEPGRVCWE